MESVPDTQDIDSENTDIVLQEFTCRICLFRHQNNIELTGSIFADVAKNMNRHLDIKVPNDESHMWICKFCSQTLLSFHRFYDKVDQIQNSLCAVSAVIKNEPNYSNEKLEAELERIEMTVGFARGKKARSRTGTAVVEPVRRTSTRKRKTRARVVEDTGSGNGERVNERTSLTILEGHVNDKVDRIIEEENIQCESVTVKTENIEEFSIPDTAILPNPIENISSKDDDISSLEDQDWVGQGFSFDIDSDSDHTWEPPKTGSNQRRSTTKRKSNGQSDKTSKASSGDEEAKSQLSKETHSDTTKNKLRITATHGSEPKPKIPSNVRKLLRMEVNAKFVDFYGITCDICEIKSRENTVPVNTKYQTFEALCAHMQEEHNERGYVKCCNCTMREKRRAERHMLLHTEPGSIFKCNICGKQLSSQQSFRCHILLHLPDSERPFQCNLCDRGFVTKADLTQHERQHLPEDKRLCYTCDICGSRFTAEAGLVAHKLRVHENVRPHLCDLCAKSFSSRCDMERHRAQIHGNVKREQCPECGKWFKGSSILKTHMRQHKGQLFKCQYCDKVYKVRSSWKAHLVTHSDAKPHKCPVCEKTFKLPGTLKMHLNQHTGELPYSCPFCPKKFASSGNYYTHRKRMHRDEVVKLKEATEAALAASGIPPPSTAPLVTTSISEAIARTKEKVAAQVKTSVVNPHEALLQPPPPLVDPNSGQSVVDPTLGIMEEAPILIPSVSTILTDGDNTVGSPSISVPSLGNLPRGSDSGLLLTQTEKILTGPNIPVSVTSVSSNTIPLHVIPNTKKLPNMTQFAPGTLKLIRILSPEGTAKLVFVKSDQSSNISLIGKEVAITNQPTQLRNDLSQEDINVDGGVLSATVVS